LSGSAFGLSRFSVVCSRFDLVFVLAAHLHQPDPVFSHASRAPPKSSFGLCVARLELSPSAGLSRAFPVAASAVEPPPVPASRLCFRARFVLRLQILPPAQLAGVAFSAGPFPDFSPPPDFVCLTPQLRFALARSSCWALFPLLRFFPLDSSS
jgi:hypothetical protein